MSTITEGRKGEAVGASKGASKGGWENATGSPDAPAKTVEARASKIDWLNFSSTPMRAFHMSWLAFFACFFGWFGVAPLMAVVREEFSLTQTQIGNIIIASVAVTIFMRLALGYLCDRYGPRLTYTWLLVLGSLPVMGIGFSYDYESFLFFRLLIGAIGASFVITQYHTSIMFAPNVVGTANATSAGWGNLGGGATQIIMPLIFAGMLHLGANQFLGWRLAMVVSGCAILLLGVAYFFLTKDTPLGNFKELRAKGLMPNRKCKSNVRFWDVAKDPRVWILFLLYGCCFGIELTINNVAALYFRDSFGLSLGTAGMIAGLFGLMNIFARTLGGLFADKIAIKKGLNGRVLFLAFTIAAEGIALVVFSQMEILLLVVATMIVFSIFVQMAEGATFSIVPFINPKGVGIVAGIVGAGGNAGAVAAGFLIRDPSISMSTAFLILGVVIFACSSLALAISFSPAAHKEERMLMSEALAVTGD